MKLFLFIMNVVLLVIVYSQPVEFTNIVAPEISYSCSNSSKDSCGAIDDVNNPAYNMKEVIKNTLLIEDHLSNKNKYCKQCLVKHFLLSQSYLSEAVWMAADKTKQYPLLEETVPFYNSIFDDWYANMDNDETRLQILAKLRDWRRKAIELYYFNK